MERNIPGRDWGTSVVNYYLILTMYFTRAGGVYSRRLPFVVDTGTVTWTPVCFFPCVPPKQWFRSVL